MKNYLIKIGLLSVFLAGVTASVFAEDNGKIAVVYLKKAFDSYEKTVEYDKKLAKETEALEAKKQELKNEVDKLKSSIELLSGKERAEKIKEMQEKELKVRNYVLKEMKRIGKERDNYLKEILKDIKPIISEYAKEKGLDVVLNGDNILYAKDALDITDTVVDRLNKEYNKK